MELDEMSVTLGGRTIGDAWDRVSRYCGLPWSGGPPETWAFQYYDTIPPSSPNVVTPSDVTAAAALHPGLTKCDLAFFVEQSEALTAWLSAIPSGSTADDLRWHAKPGDDTLVRHVGSLTAFASHHDVNFALLTKVMHRKRPHVVPIVDRHIVDWYRPITGTRSAVEAYPTLVTLLAGDLRVPAGESLSAMQREVARRTGRSVSLLRLADIVLWMGGVR